MTKRYLRMSRPFARAGERVTCHAGHHVCTLVRDLEPGKLAKLSCLGDWQPGIEVPVNKVPFTTCNCWCGEPWVGHLENRKLVICIEGDWRPRA